jgi:choline monooxygenase
MPSNVTAEILSNERIARLDLPIGEARGLPPKAYTSSDFFNLENDRLFRGGWMSVAFSHDIPNPGDAIPLSVAGVELLVVRDEEQNVRAFHNVCRHRASTVLQAPATGLSELRCPYHCWSYELDGRLRSAPMWEGPGRGKLGSLDARENALAPIRCGEWQDLIFVNVTGTAPPLEKFVALLEQRWQRFDLGALHPFAHSERVIHANWKVVLEGFLEVYHESCLHKNLTYRVDRDGKPTWTDIMDGDVMGFTGALPAVGEDGPAPALPRVPGMPSTGPAPADIVLLFPSTSINVMDDHVVRTIWTPVSPTETRWRSAWYFAGDACRSDTMRKTCEEIVEFWHDIRTEDLGALLRVQKGLSSWDSSPKEIKFAPFWEEIVRNFQRHIVRRLMNGVEP